MNGPIAAVGKGNAVSSRGEIRINLRERACLPEQ